MVYLFVKIGRKMPELWPFNDWPKVATRPLFGAILATTFDIELLNFVYPSYLLKPTYKQNLRAIELKMAHKNP